MANTKLSIDALRSGYAAYSPQPGVCDHSYRQEVARSAHGLLGQAKLADRALNTLERFSPSSRFALKTENKALAGILVDSASTESFVEKNVHDFLKDLNKNLEEKLPENELKEGEKKIDTKSVIYAGLSSSESIVDEKYDEILPKEQRTSLYSYEPFEAKNILKVGDLVEKGKGALNFALNIREFLQRKSNVSLPKTQINQKVSEAVDDRCELHEMGDAKDWTQDSSFDSGFGDEGHLAAGPGPCSGELGSEEGKELVDICVNGTARRSVFDVLFSM